MARSLKNKVALITGGSRGIGLAIARAFVGEGMRVALTATSKERLAGAAEALAPVGSAEIFPADLTRDEDLARVVPEVRQALGPIEVLVHSAGVFIREDVVQMSLEQWDLSMNLNARAGFALCRAVIPDMVRSRWGRIILIGSSSSYIGTKGGAAYCASKHALLGLGRSLYHELREDNVRVHVVSPGTVATDMGAQLTEQDATTFIQPDQIAEMVLFLAKTEGNAIAEEVRVNRMIYR